MVKVRQILWLALLMQFLLSVGCNRSFYRRQADREVYNLVAEKANNPRWALPGYTINVDAQSRMYSPFSWDFPPMPPDDPYSHKLMHYVDDKKGYPFWHVNGDTPFAENPMWKSFLLLNEEGVLVLSADDSVRMALLQSRDYQSQLETLYLSALDVTFERFQFDSQFNAGYALDFLHQGRHRNGFNTGSRSRYTMTTFPEASDGIAMRKMGTTGTSLVVGLANRLVWQFSGPDSYTARTLLDFSLVQPILQSAGRDRIMERLTIVERALLANVRQMERYRRGFYVEVTTGQDAGSGPTRRGGFFGGSGLGGFTGTGGGGFGGIGNVGGFGGGGGTGGANVGGYLGLLQDQQTIRNQETNVSQLRNALAQFEAFFNAQRIDYLQVQQVRNDLYREQSVLLSLKTTYETTLDTFKIQLGLPPSLDVKIEDSMIDTFNLIDDAIDEPQERLASLQRQLGQAVVAIIDENPEGAAGIPWSEKLAKRLENLKRIVAESEALRKSIIANNIPRARNDIEILQKDLDTRVETLDRLREQVQEAVEEGASPGIEPTVLDSKRIKQLPGKLKKELELLEKGETGETEEDKIKLEKSFDSLKESLAASESEINDLLKNHAALTPDEILIRLRGKQIDLKGEEEVIPFLRFWNNIGFKRVFELKGENLVIPSLIESIPAQLADLSTNTLELTLIQAQARTEAVDLIPIEMQPKVAFEIAENYRRDWMNSRAALVDSWRLVEFNADNLESVLDIVFEGDITNARDNPLDLRASAGSLRVGAQFDSPVNRLAERNSYRQTLIEYAQARRQYYTIVDRIDQGLRSILRNVELNQLNFEVRRQAVLNSIKEVLLATLRLQEPPKPNQPPDATQTLGATTARDLVSALNNLRNAQNDFMNIWVTYETLRRSLDFNLGTMQLDPDGVWMDPGKITPETGPPGEAAIYPGTFCPPDALFVPSDEATPLEELEPPVPGEFGPPNPLELPLPGQQGDADDESENVTASAEEPIEEPPLPEQPSGPPAELLPLRHENRNPLRPSANVKS